MSDDYDEGSTGEDFGGPRPFGGMIECDLCGWTFRTPERLSAHEGDEMCREVQAERALRAAR